MFTADDDDGWSYFINSDLLTDVIACPGVDFPPLKNSCYISREQVFGLARDDDGNLLYPEQNQAKFSDLKTTVSRKEVFGNFDENVYMGNAEITLLQEKTGPILVKRR